MKIKNLRRGTGRLLLFMIALAPAIFTNAQKTASLAGSRPNIILLVVDDMGYNDLGCFDNPYVQTPNIDKLAKSGIKATQGYVNAANCAPTRAALMSGLYPPRTGIYTVGSSLRGHTEDRRLVPVKNHETLEKKFPTIAEMLSAAGYNTCMGGKWHLGENGFGAADRGFQQVLMGGGKSGHQKSVWPPYGVENQGHPADSAFITDYLTDKAIDYLSKADHQKPFFLYLPHFVVHAPIGAPTDLTNKYKDILKDEKRIKPAYAAMIENLDQNIGRLMKSLQQLKLDDNTLVIIMSDNGPHAGSTTYINLRGTKGSLYEGGARVPYIFYWKGKLQPGATAKQPFIGIDLYPTFLELAGIQKNKWPKLDGQSLLPMLAQPAAYAKARTMFWHFPAYLENGNEERGWRQTPGSSVRSGDWKLIESFEYNRYELYNLATDPKETTDLSHSNTAKAKELLTLLHNWQKQTGAFIPTALNKGYQKEYTPGSKKKEAATGDE